MGLGLDEAFFDGQRAGDSYWCMRVIHYPPLAAASEPANVALPVDGEIERSVQLSCGEHTDYGARVRVISSTHAAAWRWRYARFIHGARVLTTGCSSSSSSCCGS